MATLPFTYGIQVSWSRSTLCRSTSLPQKRSTGAKWSLLLWLADEEGCHGYFERELLPKTEKRSLLTLPLHDGIDRFCEFHGRNRTDDTVRHTGGAICKTTFATSECTAGRRCRRHICARQVLRWVYRKSRHESIIIGIIIL